MANFNYSFNGLRIWLTHSGMLRHEKQNDRDYLQISGNGINFTALFTIILAIGNKVLRNYWGICCQKKGNDFKVAINIFYLLSHPNSKNSVLKFSQS